LLTRGANPRDLGIILDHEDCLLLIAQNPSAPISRAQWLPSSDMIARMMRNLNASRLVCVFPEAEIAQREMPTGGQKQFGNSSSQRIPEADSNK
jgi:hypothetical protein